MKRITILAATLFALSGLQAQTGIDGVLRNIETNNKELQAKCAIDCLSKTGNPDRQQSSLIRLFRMPIRGIIKTRIIRSENL